MIISRISLIGEPSVTVHIPEGESPEPASLLVISGPNGSGKSLLTLAIEACFAAEDVRGGLASAVHSAGVERIEIAFRRNGWAGLLAFDLPDGPRSIEWEHGGAETEEPPEDIVWGELFTSVHRVHSGHVAVQDFGAVERSVARLKRGPLEAELARWSAVELELAGADGKGGRLGEVRAECDAVSADLQRVEQIAQDLEKARTRQQDLTIRMNDAAAQRDILRAEAEELTKASALADRAMRLDIWVAEIRQESRAVQKLREQHSALQERLDELERRFRGVPDDFPSLLEDYDSMLRRERELRERASEARGNMDRLRIELQEIEAHLQRLAAPQEDDLIARRDRLGREIEVANTQITELLRGRIEVVRQRDGLEQHLHRKFQAFADLTPDIRKFLREFFTRNGHAPQEENAEDAPVESTEPYESRETAIRAKLREKFSGYEDLPASTPAVLRELYDQRHAFGSLSSDLEGLKARSAALRRKMSQSRSLLWSIVAGAVGFGAGTALFAWDIGLFLGLLASGLTLLAFQYAHRRIESDIESATSAEAMTQRRYDTAREAVARLERMLKPILHITDLDEATAQLEEYQRLTRELNDVTATLVRIRAAEEMPREKEDSSSALRALLPEPLAHVPLPVLKQLHSEFVLLEQQIEELSEEWSRYAEGGALALQIRTLEDEIAGLHEEQSQLAAEVERRNQSYLMQHNDLLERRAVLEDALTAAEREAGADDEMSEIRVRLGELDREVGGLLKETDLDGLRAEWRERDGLRARLRETRDALSAKQTHDELRAREALLSEELAQVRHRLLDLDPLYMLQGTAADYSAKYAGQLQRLRDDMNAAEEEARTLQGEVGKLNVAGRAANLSAERPIEELREAVADAKEHADAVEREVRTVRERISALTSELEGMNALVSWELAAAVDKQVRAFSADRLKGVQFIDGECHAVAADGTVRALKNLSDGTCDLVWLAIRVAVLEYLHGSDVCPVIWDEALSRLDERHLTNVRVALVRLCSQRQVLLLTRHSSFEWWGPSVRLSAPAQSVFSI